MKKASATTLKSIIVLILTICLLSSCSLFDSNDKSDPHNTSAVEQTSENHSLSEDAENQKKELTKAFQELTFEDTTTVESDLQNAYKISELLNNLEATFLNGADFFSLDQAMHCNQLCFEALKTLEESDKVEYVSGNPFDTFVRFKSGLNYLYQPKTEQLLNRNDNEAFQLIAIEPYYEEFKVIPFTFEKQYQESYQPLLESGFADLTEPLLNQPKLYRNDQFSLDVLKNLPKYSVIHWIGHGTSVKLKIFTKKKTPVLMTNIKAKSVKDFDYFKTLYRDRKIENLFGLTNNDTVFITPEFLRLTIPDNSLEGSIVHLGACRSAYQNKDEPSQAFNDELLQVFIDKGAAFVTGYTDYVQVDYEKEIKKILTKQMMETKQDESFMLLKDALEKARILVAEKAQDDSSNWENGFDIYTRNNGYESVCQLVYLENPDFPNYSLGNLIEKKQKHTLSDLAELIKTEENNGQIVLSGTIRILSGDELCTLQGVDPLYQDNDQHTVFVLDEVKNMDVVSMGGIKNCDVSMIEIKDLSQSQDYDGKEAVISFDPSELRYPSDASLPLGEPRTTVYKILSAK